MKYKLLKDTPTIKAGTIFEEVTSDYDELKERKPYTFIRATIERTISQNCIHIKAGGLVRVSVREEVFIN